MKKLILGILLMLSSGPLSYAQTVGTIGIGKMDLSIEKNTAKLSSGQQILNSIVQTLQSSLVDTRKFRVLDNAQLNQFLNERSLELDSYYQPEEKNAQVDYFLAGLDYILSMDIDHLGVYSQKRVSSEVLTGVINIKFTLLGVADATSTITSEITTQTNIWFQAGETLDPQSVLNQTIEQGIDKVTLRIISRLFPIRVMQISDSGTIKLNYGNGFLKAGDTVFIYDGEVDDIFDETGEATAESIATLQIIDADKRFSNAQALSGLENIKLRNIGQVLINE